MRSLKYVQLHINQGFTHLYQALILMVKWTYACGLAEENFVCVHMLHFWGLKDISEIYHHLLP